MSKGHKPKKMILVLFGATGDLALKKIFPALGSLYRDKIISDSSRIIAVSRRDWSDVEFVSYLTEAHPGMSSAFLKLLSYSKVDVDGDEGYEALKAKIDSYKRELRSAHVLIYLSLAPQNHPKAIDSLRKSKILGRGDTKLLIEKPFGTNESSAKSLDKKLSFLFERQICRVDHYLGKETVGAIMDLHESTPDFDSLMSSESVASIRVTLFETKGIDDRGNSYDKVGAFRDVGQNHMLEMLAVVAAKLPKNVKKDPRAWQASRTEVFTHLAPPKKTCDQSRRGQYIGYQAEKGVSIGSQTETAFEVITTLSSGKLKGTPLILESGKRMDKGEAFVEVRLKDLPELPRSIVFKIQPQHEIVISYNGGFVDTFKIPAKRDAYEKIISAALFDSSREFVGKSEIEALWRYADRIVECWDKVPLESYGPGKPFFPLSLQ